MTDPIRRLTSVARLTDSPAESEVSTISRLGAVLTVAERAVVRALVSAIVRHIRSGRERENIEA